MPLREDILNPVSEFSPAGQSLRYSSVTDRIQEARSQDDDAPQGDWQRERKLANYPLVIQMASEAIAIQGKDLQIAAWLTEALLAVEGYSGLSEGLSLIKEIVERFWDGCWPELEGEDCELRAAPVDWVGQYLVIPAKRVSLTRNGYDFLRYQEARSVGTEPAYEDSDARKEAYQAALSEGRLPMEEFEKSVRSTSKDFYVATLAGIDSSLQIIKDSQPLFSEKFGSYEPSWNRLRDSIEEVRRLVHQILQKKVEAEAQPATEETVEETEAGDPDIGEQPAEEIEAPAAPPPRRRARSTAGPEPADREDAALRISALASFWRKEDPYSPAPYLMLRGIRWGEIRASSSLDSSLFEAPDSTVRTTVKRLLAEGSYSEMIEAAEEAMAQPCGRAWLDLQRYVVSACENLGYSAIAAAIRAELKALLADYPDLLTASLADDTPAANRETVAWISEFATPAQEAPAVAPPAWSMPASVGEEDSPDIGIDAAPDSFELAMEAVRGGRTEEAFSMLADEIGRQNSGRGKFQRKLQLAQICLATGHEGIAQPLLEELQNTVDRHQLEDWEAPDVVAHALSLLYACAQRTDGDPAATARLYARICRLSPLHALQQSGHAFAHRR